MPPLATNMALFPAAWLVPFMYLLSTADTRPAPSAISAFDGMPRENPGRLSAFLKEWEIPCDSFDIRNSEKQDCTLDCGTQVFLQMLAQVALESLLWLGPPCCSWIWISRNSHKRSRLNLYGSGSDWTQHHYQIALFVANAILAATARGPTVAPASYSYGRFSFVLLLRA